MLSDKHVVDRDRFVLILKSFIPLAENRIRKARSVRI
jgi:hypothetical protein